MSTAQGVHRSWTIRILGGCVLLAVLLWAATPTFAADYTVTSAADAGPGTLRDAVVQANGIAGPHLITFAPGLAGSTITLTTIGLTDHGPSALPILRAITIQGDATSGITLSVSGTAMRHFFVGRGASLTLRNATLSGGLARGFDGGTGDQRGGGGGGAAGLGGAIYVDLGALTIEHCTLVGNTAQGGNGGNRGGASAWGAGGGGAGMDGAGANAPGPTGSGGGGDGGANTPPGSGGAWAAGLQNGGPGGSRGGGGGGAAGRTGAAGWPAGNAGSGGHGSGGGGGGSYDPLGFPGGVGGSGGAGGFGGGGGGSGGGTPDGTPGAGGFGAGSGGPGDGSGNIGGAGGGGSGMGGAIFNDGGTVMLTNSTISGNAAIGGLGGTSGGAPSGADGLTRGGGLFTLNGTVTVQNATFSDNTLSSASSGGAIYVSAFGGGTATITMNNTILANSGGSAWRDYWSYADTGMDTVIEGGTNNVIEDYASFGGTNTINADPELNALAGNGGPNQTHAISSDTSPPVDAGDIPSAPSVDQRYLPRDAAPDVGAFEFDLIPPTVTCSVSRRLLFPARGAMINAGLSASATDNMDPPNLLTLAVGGWSDEGNGPPPFTPDARLLGSLVLVRSDRDIREDGRVYLLRVSATDTTGNIGYGCCTVVVPRIPTMSSIMAVLAEAADAEDICNGVAVGFDPGDIPPGYANVLPPTVLP